jgi:primase-polymerase (primpol)-like protein
LYYFAKEVNEKKKSEETKNLVKRSFIGAIMSHIVSFGSAFAIAKYTDEKILKYRTSYLFLVSGLIRPVLGKLKDYSHKIYEAMENLRTIKRKIQPVDDYEKLNGSYSTYNENFNELKSKIENVKENLQYFEHRFSQLKNDKLNQIKTVDLVVNEQEFKNTSEKIIIMEENIQKHINNIENLLSK